MEAWPGEVVRGRGAPKCSKVRGSVSLGEQHLKPLSTLDTKVIVTRAAGTNTGSLL